MPLKDRLQFGPKNPIREELTRGNGENLSQDDYFKIADPPKAAFQACNDIASDIPTGNLALRRKHGLRPAPRLAKLLNLRTNDVAKSRCVFLHTAKLARKKARNVWLFTHA